MTVKITDLPKLQSREVYEQLGIKPKFFPQRKAGKNFVMTAYYDARDVAKVLDHVCCIGNWQNEPRNIDGKLYMGIGINIEGEGWIWKFDVGVESKIEKEKGEASDAFKRAGFKWGIFAQVYDMEEILLPIAPDGKNPMTHSGKVLATSDQQTAYCNAINHGAGMLGRIYLEYKSEIDAHDRVLEAVKTLGEFLKTIKD
jgi:hypothetical protein